MAGVSAAYLAKDGFTGAPAITIEDAVLRDFWSDLGQTWRIDEQYMKLYPVCRWAQPAVEAALSLVEKHQITASRIELVEIETFHEAKRLNVIPNNTEQAQYSLPFSVAAALVRGSIGVPEVTTSGLMDNQILDLAKTVRITETDEFNKSFPARRFARATLRLKDGIVVTSEPTEAKGDPEDKFDDEVVWSKFNGLVEPVLGKGAATNLAQAIRSLPADEDVSTLFNLICQSKEQQHASR